MILVEISEKKSKMVPRLLFHQKTILVAMADASITCQLPSQKFSLMFYKIQAIAVDRTLASYEQEAGYKIPPPGTLNNNGLTSEIKFKNL